jgi:hypothetical protein
MGFSAMIGLEPTTRRRLRDRLNAIAFEGMGWSVHDHDLKNGSLEIRDPRGRAVLATDQEARALIKALPDRASVVDAFAMVTLFACSLDQLS